MYSELPNHNKIELEAFVDVVLGAGYQLSVYDGDGSWSAWSDDRSTLLDSLGEMDSDQVRAYKYGNFAGWFWLVYGNGSGELISDYTANAACHSIYEAWATKVGVE